MSLKQITVGNERVTCDCGFYDKGFDLVKVARIHNSREHAGNYVIWDMVHGQRSQLTGEVITKHDRNTRK